MRGKLIAAATAIALGLAMPTTTAAEQRTVSTEAEAYMPAVLEGATSVEQECTVASEATAVFPAILDMEATGSASVVMALAHMAEVISDGELGVGLDLALLGLRTLWPV
jgi:hypothetical protein